MLDKVKRKPAKRTQHRSRSGAQTKCTFCEKKLRGSKGLVTHLVDQHGMSLEEAKAKAEVK